ncbi:hypothetical protein M1494_02030 [Candidatus Parvarchaeota archaeon]|nr:hypothetical protein [Candidatus Parvarchaeota archaeon]
MPGMLVIYEKMVKKGIRKRVIILRRKADGQTITKTASYKGKIHTRAIQHAFYDKCIWK